MYSEIYWLLSSHQIVPYIIAQKVCDSALVLHKELNIVVTGTIRVSVFLFVTLL